MLKKVLTSTAFALALTAGTYSVANAAGGSNCQIIYGGGEVCQKQVSFTLDKKVQSPTKGGQFVDNLGMNDARFAPNSTVTFSIIVKNTGSTKIDSINVKDELPNYLTANSGNYDYTITNLEPGKEHKVSLTAKTASAENLPSDKAITCVVNTVKATENTGNTAQDSTQLCIEKQITNVPSKVFETPNMKTTPSTGPEMLSLLALIPTGAAGLYLRKRSK